MSRHFYFRNYLHLAIGGISHNLTDIIFCIISTHRSKFSLLLATAVRKRFVTLYPPCSHLSKQRIFFYFQTPSGVIDKMQVQLVQLQHCSHVNHLQQIGFRKKIARHVDHHTAIAKTRTVGNFHYRHFHRLVSSRLAVDCSRQKLTQSLKRIEKA